MEFASEAILHIGPFPLTNTIISTLLVDMVLVGMAFLVSKKISKIPGYFQSIMELAIGGFYSFTESIAGNKAPKIFPYFMSFFLFILIANWSGLIPGIGTFGIEDHGHIIPYIRATTTDLNTTLALAFISLVATHYLSFKTLGFTDYLSRFVPILGFVLASISSLVAGKGIKKVKVEISGPISIVMLAITPFVYNFVGLLELVSEFVKVVSLSFRLFGNVYAGEIVLETISGISKFTAFLVPIPFLLLEVVVGLVQALVFSMLTMAFMVILTTPHHETSEEVSH